MFGLLYGLFSLGAKGAASIKDICDKTDRMEFLRNVAKNKNELYFKSDCGNTYLTETGEKVSIERDLKNGNEKIHGFHGFSSYTIDVNKEKRQKLIDQGIQVVRVRRKRSMSSDGHPYVTSTKEYDMIPDFNDYYLRHLKSNKIVVDVIVNGITFYILSRIGRIVDVDDNDRNKTPKNGLTIEEITELFNHDQAELRKKIKDDWMYYSTTLHHKKRIGNSGLFENDEVVYTMEDYELFKEGRDKL